MTNNDGQHVAMPKLYGAPAYARPPAAVAHTMRPFDPDDLPIEAEQTSEEREMARELVGRPYGGTPVDAMVHGNGNGTLRGRPFRLRALTDRLRAGGNGGR